MVTWGLDVSEYQPHFDFHRARREGFDFAGLRAVGSRNNFDRSFPRHLRLAREAGLVCWGYLFQSPHFSATAQVDTIVGSVPRDCPVVIDSEIHPHSGPLALTWEITNRLRAAGYRVPLLYLPSNMWASLGRPDLRGLAPGLWRARYPDNRGGFASQIYQRVPSCFWDGYGGLPVLLLQFSQSATIAGNTPTDADAYLGTRQQLEQLIYGEEGDDMFSDRDRHNLVDIAQQLSGSRTAGQFPGWENFVNGNRVTFTNFIRWIHANSFHVEGKEAGQAKAISELVDALGSETFDESALLARVAEATRAALAAKDSTEHDTGAAGPVEQPTTGTGA